MGANTSHCPGYSKLSTILSWGRAAAVLHEVQIVGELLSVRQVFSDFRKCAADVLLSGDESALTGSACTCS